VHNPRLYGAQHRRGERHTDIHVTHAYCMLYSRVYYKGYAILRVAQVFSQCHAFPLVGPRAGWLSPWRACGRHGNRSA